MNSRTQLLIECVSLAERIVQRAPLPIGPAAVGGLGPSARTVDEVLEAAEQVRAWIEKPRNGRRTQVRRK